MGDKSRKSLSSDFSNVPVWRNRKSTSRSAGTLDATFSASSSEESYCWTAIWHVSELDWPAEESMVVALFHLKVLHYSVPIRYRYFAWPTAILPPSTLKAHSGLALILSICYGGYRSRAHSTYLTLL